MTGLISCLSGLNKSQKYGRILYCPSAFDIPSRWLRDLTSRGHGHYGGVMERRIFLAKALAASVSLVALGGCGGEASFKTYPRYRYRLTVEVDTPEGRRSGSSVIEVKDTADNQHVFGPMAIVRSDFQGEAVMVDLGKRGKLFALLCDEDNLDWASSGVAQFAERPSLADVRGLPDTGIDPTFDLFMQRVRALRGTFVVRRWRPLPSIGPKEPRSGYPLLVRFRDITQPASVEEVNPDDLAASFGSGVSLRRLVVTTTDDPVTSTLAKTLTWLGTGPDTALEGDPTPGVPIMNRPVSTEPLPLSQRLSNLDFRREKF